MDDDNVDNGGGCGNDKIEGMWNKVVWVGYRNLNIPKITQYTYMIMVN